ncbi:protein FAR1-RELATED SEQUENCE 8-like [Silene latifolia]|uniref:protein FAR1-RELATED SEQUENCE 8-like n=1 Tax=Silene latifolia TaxID=37657 RepID=UPI003D772E5C
MDAQRWKYSKVMANDKNCYPKLTTPLLLEKQASEFYTIVIFYIFQVEVQAACYACGHLPSPNTTGSDTDHISIIDREKDKMFERIGIVCRHVLWVLKDRGFYDIPKEYLAPRWSKSATSHPLSNVVGTSVLADCVSMENRHNNISELWSEVFNAVSLAEDNEEHCDALFQMLHSFNEIMIISVKPGKSKDKKDEVEMLLRSKIPTEATVLPPEKCKNKGSGKWITLNKENAVLENAKPLGKCHACGEMINHDSRNCPSQLA